MSSKLDQLKKVTVVVADTGDISSIKKYQPQDATTNPSLILQASKLPEYAHLAQEAVEYAKSKKEEDFDANAMDYLTVAIGTEISKIVPGYVSTEVDIREAFNVKNTVRRARKLIDLYAEKGVSKERILIKIAATQEGITAAKVLEEEGIQCNLTLLFSFAQARLCAEAGVTLISPFVGRILDYYRGQNPDADYSGEKDPGVVSVKEIYQYYKAHGYKTIVMGASFRNTDEIEQLAGCDRLTIGPSLLEQLANDQGKLELKLDAKAIPQATEKPQVYEADKFLWDHNQNTMAIVKLAEGIYKFAADTETLIAQLRALKG